jgi:hypothetical protein
MDIIQSFNRLQLHQDFLLYQQVCQVITSYYAVVSYFNPPLLLY